MGRSKKTVARTLAAIAVSAAVATIPALSSAATLTVLEQNLWHSGIASERGMQDMVAVVQATKPNVIVVSEAGNQSGSIPEGGTARLAKILNDAREPGAPEYKSVEFGDKGILTTLPVKASADVDGFTKAIVDTGDGEVAIYSAHLNYQKYATMRPRGMNDAYNKITPVTDVTKLNAENEASGRPAAIAKFIADAQKEIAAGRSVILGGDFNEPSALDWTERAKNTQGRNGVAIQWGSTKLLNDAGFVDAYRSAYPDEVTHPGSTWVSFVPGKNPAVKQELAWAPSVDERDRIDYIFTGGANIRLADVNKDGVGDVGLVGPQRVVRAGKYIDQNGEVATLVDDTKVTTNDHFAYTTDEWFSDHKGVLATYEVGQKGSVTPQAKVPAEASTSADSATANAAESSTPATLTKSVRTSTSTSASAPTSPAERVTAAPGEADTTSTQKPAVPSVTETPSSKQSETLTAQSTKTESTNAASQPKTANSTTSSESIESAVGATSPDSGENADSQGNSPN